MLESIFTVSKVFLTSGPKKKKRHTLKYAVALYANQDKIIASETPGLRAIIPVLYIVCLSDTSQIPVRYLYSLSCERKYYMTQYVSVCTEIKSSKSVAVCRCADDFDRILVIGTFVEPSSSIN